MSRRSRRARRQAAANAAVAVPQNNMPVPIQNNQMPAMQQNTGLPAIQNMQQILPNVRPQYMPPVQGQSLQTSPQTRSQRRIENARFPRLRAWWEGVKGAVGGQPEEVQQYSNVSPEQRSILEYLQLLGAYGLNDPYSEFEPIAEQAQNEFNQQVVPSLAERFTSLGKGSISSPAFASQLGQAGAGLQQNLAALRSDYGQQNRGQALQMLQLGLNPYTENIYRPATPGLARQAVNAGINALPGLLI